MAKSCTVSVVALFLINQWTPSTENFQVWTSIQHLCYSWFKTRIFQKWPSKSHDNMSCLDVVLDRQHRQTEMEGTGSRYTGNPLSSGKSLRSRKRLQRHQTSSLNISPGYVRQGSKRCRGSTQNPSSHAPHDTALYEGEISLLSSSVELSPMARPETCIQGLPDLSCDSLLDFETAGKGSGFIDMNPLHRRSTERINKANSLNSNRTAKVDEFHVTKLQDLNSKRTLGLYDARPSVGRSARFSRDPIDAQRHLIKVSDMLQDQSLFHGIDKARQEMINELDEMNRNSISFSDGSAEEPLKPSDPGFHRLSQFKKLWKKVQAQEKKYMHDPNFNLSTANTTKFGPSFVETPEDIDDSFDSNDKRIVHMKNKTYENLGEAVKEFLTCLASDKRLADKKSGSNSGESNHRSSWDSQSQSQRDSEIEENPLEGDADDVVENDSQEGVTRWLDPEDAARPTTPGWKRVNGGKHEDGSGVSAKPTLRCSGGKMSTGPQMLFEREYPQDRFKSPMKSIPDSVMLCQDEQLDQTNGRLTINTLCSRLRLGSHNSSAVILEGNGSQMLNFSAPKNWCGQVQTPPQTRKLLSRVDTFLSSRRQQFSSSIPNQKSSETTVNNRK
mmetsp:Transcript_80047/g.214264  ORF Transcript_80047/g.214264 Transcript_80047/m.214264 type:complete len:613 (-) Transcript_80047:332-2170(-)